MEKTNTAGKKAGANRANQEKNQKAAPKGSAGSAQAKGPDKKKR